MNILLRNLLKQNHTGERNGITAEILFADKNIALDGETLPAFQRRIRTETAELIKEGNAICSSDAGYFYAGNNEELERYISRLTATYIHTKERVDALKQILQDKIDENQGVLYPERPERIYV